MLDSTKGVSIHGSDDREDTATEPILLQRDRRLRRAHNLFKYVQARQLSAYSVNGCDDCLKGVREHAEPRS